MDAHFLSDFKVFHNADHNFMVLDPCMAQLGNQGALQGRKNMEPHMYNIAVWQFSRGGGCDWIRGTEMFDLQGEKKEWPQMRTRFQGV